MVVNFHRLSPFLFRELQHTVSSLQKNIQMLKSEVSRYKTRAHKAEEKINKIVSQCISRYFYISDYSYTNVFQNLCSRIV